MNKGLDLPVLNGELGSVHPKPRSRPRVRVGEKWASVSAEQRAGRKQEATRGSAFPGAQPRAGGSRGEALPQRNLQSAQAHVPFKASWPGADRDKRDPGRALWEQLTRSSRLASLPSACLSRHGEAVAVHASGGGGPGAASALLRVPAPRTWDAHRSVQVHGRPIQSEGPLGPCTGRPLGTQRSLLPERLPRLSQCWWEGLVPTRCRLSPPV